MKARFPKHSCSQSLNPVGFQDISRGLRPTPIPPEHDPLRGASHPGRVPAPCDACRGRIAPCPSEPAVSAWRPQPPANGCHPSGMVVHRRFQRNRRLPICQCRRLAAVRGNDCNGVAEATNLPTHWSETENVAWKAELPGKGPSSPIVVAGHVIVTSSSSAKQDRLHVLSFSAATGKLEWQRQFWATGRTMCQLMTAVAAPTPASDGQRIFALFSSSDLVCLDLKGNLLWYRGLQLEHPAAGNDVGMASSPVVIGETVIVQIESQGDAFAAGFDTETGDTRWQIERPRLGNWSSPTVLHGKSAGDDLVLLQSTTEISLHDPLTGQERWSQKLACNDITSTAADGDKLFVPANGIHAFQFQAADGQAHSIWTPRS